MVHQLTLSQMLEGYRLNVEARHLSVNTIKEYYNTYRKFTAWCLANGLADPTFRSITTDHLKKFLASLTISKKTIKNYHIGLSALWTWAVLEKFVPENILHQVPVAKPEKRQIVPFSLADAKALAAACRKSAAYTRPGKKIAENELRDGDRMYAMLLLLIDTGLRASELTGATIANVDIKNNRIEVFGKGTKQRSIPFSSRTGTALWRYLATRPDARVGDPLFATRTGLPIDRTNLDKILGRLGDRAGVTDCHAHRFRHTFAITYLRNSGDPFTLQILLGHERMDTVKIYIDIASSDLDAAHRRASPVDNWRL